MMKPIQLAIFDLDGTLLDTLSDLAFSVNYGLGKCGFPIHPVEVYKNFVGNGINMLLTRALPENQKTEQHIALLRNHCIPYYDEHKTDFTKPYEGIPELLQKLLSSGLKLAVASNKYHAATEELIGQLFPDISFAAVLGQREGIPVKPDPAIVYEILQITGIPADNAVYIGDSGVDIQTASNSGLLSIGVTWGFRPREELENAGANYIANTANEIFEIINRSRRRSE